MNERIESSVVALKAFFAEGRTHNVNFRIEQLKRFKAAIIANQALIEQALWSDLHKSKEEAYLTEISIVLQEINSHIKHLRSWAKPKRVSTPLQILPSKSRILYEPLGVALIIAPWNYPFQLTLNPLVGAISAGCCAMVKPAPSSKETSKVIEKIIGEAFNSNYIDIVQGGREVNGLLLEQRYDIIFFTGSPALAKVVSRAAAEYLTPTVMELGGKSPCIVDYDADIKMAARRIVWGKFLNAGQTCVAPDYLFVHESVKDELIEKMREQIKEMFGEQPKESRFYPRVITDSAFDRLCTFLGEGDVVAGGDFDKSERYIEPTIIDNVLPIYKIMQEEIFGPILPIMSFKNIEEAYTYVNKCEKPLAFYFFGGKNSKEALSRCSAGGGCINDTIIHLSNDKLPFGGVGNSGMGCYHGKESFLAFSNKRSLVISSTLIDLPFRYVPFKFFSLVKKII